MLVTDYPMLIHEVEKALMKEKSLRGKHYLQEALKALKDYESFVKNDETKKI